MHKPCPEGCSLFSYLLTAMPGDFSLNKDFVTEVEIIPYMESDNWMKNASLVVFSVCIYVLSQK